MANRPQYFLPSRAASPLLTCAPSGLFNSSWPYLSPSLSCSVGQLKKKKSWRRVWMMPNLWLGFGALCWEVGDAGSNSSQSIGL